MIKSQPISQIKTDLRYGPTKRRALQTRKLYCLSLQGKVYLPRRRVFSTLSRVVQKSPPCIISIEKTGFSRTAQLLQWGHVCCILQRRTARRGAARRGVWWGRSFMSMTIQLVQLVKPGPRNTNGQ